MGAFGCLSLLRALTKVAMRSTNAGEFCSRHQNGSGHRAQVLTFAAVLNEDAMPAARSQCQQRQQGLGTSQLSYPSYLDQP